MAKQKTLRTTAELNARYTRFCDNHDLDETIAPAEQIAENDKQQLWLDAHVEALELAQAAEQGAEEVSTNVVLEDAHTGARKAAAILSSIGRSDAAVNAMLRRGERLAATLNIVEVSRKVALTVCKVASYQTVDTKQNKMGYTQTGWAF